MREDSVTVTTCKKYSIKSKGHSWAIIFLDDETGSLSIYSDHGSWAYHWQSIGSRTLGQFLVGCDDEYLMRKLAGRPSRFNFEKTIENTKKNILRYRRDDTFSKDEARKFWEGLDRLEYTDSVDAFGYEAYNGVLFDFTDYIDICMEWDYGIISLFKDIWPLFVAKLKEETSQTCST